jgi:peroxiredoxin Q/BCP
MLDGLFAKPLSVGTIAPDFSAKTQDGASVSLQSLRGKNVVLVFYPADDTSVCTQQLCEFRDNWNAVQTKNTMVFGVNPAASTRHESFQKKYKLPFPLIVDEDATIAKAYNSWVAFVPKRTVYLIGPDGKIRYAQRGKPSPSEVLATAA